MHDAVSVRIIQRHGNLPDDPQQRAHIRPRRGLQHGFERDAIHQFHDDIGEIVLPAGVEDGDDARVVENAGRADLAQKTALKHLLFALEGIRIQAD